MAMDATVHTTTWAATAGRSQTGRLEDNRRAGGRAEQGGRGRGLFGRATRPLRFALTGGIAAVTQLALLALLTRHGWPTLLANAVAFLLAAQVNFALSSTFTWRDRRTGRGLRRRWLAFHGSIASMAVVNMLVFLAVRTALPTLAASALGIGAAAIGNFIIGDRLVFRQQAPAARTADDEETAA